MASNYCNILGANFYANILTNAITKLFKQIKELPIFHKLIITKF